MKKWIRLAALLLAVMMLAGCNLIATDPVLDAKQIVAEIGPDVVTKGELYDLWAAALQQQASEYEANAQLYQMIGQPPFDPMDPTTRQNTLDRALEELVKQRVIAQRAKAEGLDQFTEEQLKELEPQVDSGFESYRNQAKSVFFEGTTLEGDALTAALDAKLAELNITRETVQENLKRSTIDERVRAQAIADVSVSEQEIADEYAAKLSAQKESYAATPTQYVSDALNGGTVYFVPAGYRYVKHVLLKFDDESTTKMQELEQEVSTLTGTKTDLETKVAAAADEAEKAQLGTQLEETNASLLAKEAERDALKKAAKEALQPTLDEIQQKIDLGLNFDKIVESYGQDDGMKSGEFAATGYPVIEGAQVYDPAFQEGAMSLAKVGDVTKAVESTLGFHFIKYVGDSQEHEVGVDAVRESLSATLLTQKQDAVYQSALQQWILEANVKYNAKPIDFI